MSKIAFLFGIGHGHATQFLNYQECLPTNYDSRTEWVALRGESSGDRFSKLSFLSATRRYARNQMWHARQVLNKTPEWGALFWATDMIAVTPMAKRFPSYLYIDLTPSLRAELSPWYDHQLGGNPLLKSLKHRMRQHLFHTCKGVFSMSNWAAQGIQQDFDLPASQVHVVHPGANLKRWHYVDRTDRSAARPRRILMVGGQFRLKGGELLLDWAEKTKSTNWELDIVTWPDELPDWIQAKLGNLAPGEAGSTSLAPSLPNVRVHCGLTANTPDLMSLFEEADIFCLPTQADAMSIASLEAMATGLPVIVGGVGGIPELFKDREEVNGFTIRQSDQADLNDKLEMLLEDVSLRHQVGQAARASCEDYFNVTRQLNDILRVMDK